MVAETERGPWKWDVTIYDRPGWVGRFRGRGRLASPDGERIWLRFEELERTSYYGDYFMGRHRDTWLMSPDGGRSWQLSSADEAPNVDGVALPDGSRLTVTHTIARLRGEALREYLERAGLGHLWQQESFAWWDLRSLAHRDELVRRGVAFATVRHPDAFLAFLTELSVGRCAPGSREWQWSPVEGIPPMARIAGWWRQTGVVMDDGTVVGCVHGRFAADEPHDSSFALRSTDGGRTWGLSVIAPAVAAFGFSEAYLFRVRDGRILAMIRANGGSVRLFRSYSEDGGRTWSEPEPTPVDGFPAHIIRLRGGALLCTYARRWHPQGMRAVMSHDEGRNWDVSNEKILRDDAIGSVGYPMSVQLADGTIFTACELGKPVRSEAGHLGAEPARSVAGPEDVRPSATTGATPAVSRDIRAIDMEARPQAYIAGSRYTEDFVQPLGRGSADGRQLQ